MEDNRIIDLFFGRDESGIAEVKSKYGRLCERIAYDILHNNEDSEECVSTSYMKLWNAIPPKKPQSLCGYLCRIVRNTALNLLRGSRINSEPFDELCEVIPDSETTESRFDSKQISDYINGFLENSSRKSRRIFVLRYYYNMSISSIAEGLSLTESNVKTTLSRTREHLRKHLQERGVEI